MKILHANWHYGAYGGAETYVEQLAAHLESAGHTVSVISGLSRSDPTRFVPGRKHVMIAESSGIRSGMREHDRVMHEIGQIAPDVVHLQQTGGLLSPYIEQAIQRRYPTIKTVHDVGVICPLADDLKKQCAGSLCEYPLNLGCVFRGCYSILDNGMTPLLSRLWERRVTRGMDRLLVSTQYMRRELLRNGFAEEHITILPMFTTMNQDASVAATAASRKRLLFVGRIELAKGGNELIDALEMIDPGLDWQLDVIGDGSALPALKHRVMDSALAGRIQFHGRVDANDMPAYYDRARVVVVPSMIPESFGLVGIEAMACGRPVIGFDSGGIGDWLAHAETGILVERGKVRELASGIEQLLGDDPLVESMGENAMRRVERLYRPAAHLARLVLHYEEICAVRGETKNAGSR